MEYSIAYQLGYDAYPVYDNPYHIDSESFNDYNNGFNQAVENSIKKGLEQVANGQTKYLGSFAQFVDDDK